MSNARWESRGTDTRSLALDVGDRRIGVAISDSMGIIATPHAIIERRDDEEAISEIVRTVAEKEVGKIIAGLPLDMEGGMGPQAAKVKAFVDRLAGRTNVPIEFRDERLTTVEARQIMLTSRSRKKRRKSRDDDVAAAVILQSYLDEGRNAYGPDEFRIRQSELRIPADPSDH